VKIKKLKEEKNVNVGLLEKINISWTFLFSSSQTMSRRDFAYLGGKYLNKKNSS
jgi:hypothetical protein